jgi:hypothetical protein
MHWKLFVFQCVVRNKPHIRMLDAKRFILLAEYVKNKKYLRPKNNKLNTPSSVVFILVHYYEKMIVQPLKGEEVLENLHLYCWSLFIVEIWHLSCAKNFIVGLEVDTGWAQDQYRDLFSEILNSDCYWLCGDLYAYLNVSLWTN